MGPADSPAMGFDEELPIACSLNTPELAARRVDLAANLFSGVIEVAELPDGYGLRFPGTPEWIARLAEFVRFERECCPFFTFELAFLQAQGPIWLRLRGGAGVKAFVRDGLLPEIEHGLVSGA